MNGFNLVGGAELGIIGKGESIPVIPTTQDLRHIWQGVTACSLLRWMGAQGWGTKQCRAAMVGLGLNAVADATIKAQRFAGKKGTRGALPVLTESQIDVLNQFGRSDVVAPTLDVGCGI